jgi:hypothetical protein
MADTEATAKKDINGDGAIGFKSAGAATIIQSNGFGIGRASINTPEVVVDGEDPAVVDSPNIYIVGKVLDKMGQVANNLANNAALFASLGDTPAFWAPDSDETVISLVQSSEDTEKVSVYTKREPVGEDDDQTTKYVRYNFEQEAGKWALVSANDGGTTGFTSAQLVAEESSTKRNLNGDTAVGLAAASAGVSGLTKASIDDQSFYIVGTATTGTGTRPLDLTNSKLLRNADALAWQPGEGKTISNFETVPASPPEGTPEGAKYKVTLSDDSSTYFDTSFKVVENAPAEAP